MSLNAISSPDKKPVKSGKYDNDYVFLSENCSRNRFNAVTKLSQMNAAQKNYSLTPKKRDLSPQRNSKVQMPAVFVAFV